MQQPPLLPEEALARVLRVCRVNGMSVLIASSFFALISAMSGDYVGAIAGLMVAGSGAMELHGGTLLTHYDRRGANWLVSSQLVCLLGILVYCVVRLLYVQIPPIPDELSKVIALDAKQLGMTSEQFMLRSYRIGFMLLAIGSAIYQGGMAIYYARRRRAVVRAIEVDLV